MSPRRAAAAGLAAFAISGGVAFAGGGIGGPPTLDFDRCFRDIAPCGDPVVLGKARHFNGRVEFVGMHSSIGLCLFFDNLRVGFGFGTCGGGAPLPRGDRAMSPGIRAWSAFRGDKETQITGGLVPEVARVRAKYRRDGVPKQKEAAVAQVDGELLEQLQEPRPFGIFELPMRGCIRSRFRLAAFDSGGQKLDTMRLGPARPTLCRRLGSGVAIGFKRDAGSWVTQKRPGNLILYGSPALD
jgi:hypothetical protein